MTELEASDPMKACPCCGAEPAGKFTSIPALPQILFPVSGEIRHEVPRKEIVAFRCGGCGHVFTDPLSSEDAAIIYEKLYKYYPFSSLESMNVHYRRPFEEFFSAAAGSPGEERKRLLEVGCSSEDELRFFEELGFEATGVDPGAPESGADAKVQRCYYEDHTFPESFDVVVSRFVLEHANRAGEFLGKNHADLAEEGVAFVQVPNVRQFVREFVPLFLAHEHVNYFNANSLACAARRAGFAVERLQGGESPSLLAGLRKADGAGPAAAAADVGENGSIQRELDEYLARQDSVAGQVREFLASHPEVCFYGAGLCLAWILYELEYAGQADLGTVVDDNALVRGLFMPNTDLEICGFEDFDWDRCPAVLLTLNPIYHGTVREKLRARGYAGEIHSIGESGLVKLGV